MQRKILAILLEVAQRSKQELFLATRPRIIGASQVLNKMPITRPFACRGTMHKPTSRGWRAKPVSAIGAPVRRSRNMRFARERQLRLRGVVT